MSAYVSPAWAPRRIRTEPPGRVRASQRGTDDRGAVGGLAASLRTVALGPEGFPDCLVIPSNPSMEQTGRLPGATPESEKQHLRWRDIGADAINLRDAKTGPRSVPLGEAARAHVAALPGAGDPDAFLFPRYAEGRGAYSVPTCWRAVCANAKLGCLRLHDLRHRRQPGRHGGREPALGRQAARASAPSHDGRLRPPYRWAPCRSGGEGR